VDGLGQQVGQPGDDRLRQLPALGGHREHVVRGMPVARGQRAVGVLGHSFDTRQVRGVLGRAQRDLVGAAWRVAGLALDQAVDGHLGHPPPGGQLAAGDRDHAAGGLVELGLARDVDRLLRVAGGDQRAHPGVGAREVRRAEGRPEVVVDRGEEVVDVVAGRADVVDVALVVVVGRAHEDAAQPGQHEDRAPAARGDDGAGLVDRQGLGREGDVGPAAGADRRHLGLVVQLLGADPVGPHPGGVDHVAGPHGELLPGGAVAHKHAGGPAPLLHQAGDLEPVRAHRAEALGLSQHGHDQARVVGLAVVEQVPGGRLPGCQRRDQAHDLLTADRAVAVRAPVGLAVGVGVASAAPAQRLARHHVVHVQAQAEHAIRALALERGDDEGKRADEVRRQGDHQLTLEQGLADQAEVELLEVAQAAVDELAGAAGGARGVVGLLDQRDAVAAGGGIESDAGAGDPAADHDEVEGVAAQRRDGVLTRDHGSQTTYWSGAARSGASLP
jgi:hypothetical protein